jgi:lambda repressor-like predicted transcriptional regulator
MVVHGTATGWRYYCCRCDACHRALLDEGKVAWAMRRIRAGAEPATRVSAAWPRHHLHQLETAGMTRTEIARRAGVSPGTISRLAAPDTRRISRIVAAAVMAVSP